jgi:hypothetical protein
MGQPLAVESLQNGRPVVFRPLAQDCEGAYDADLRPLTVGDFLLATHHNSKQQQQQQQRLQL